MEDLRPVRVFERRALTLGVAARQVLGGPDASGVLSDLGGGFVFSHAGSGRAFHGNPFRVAGWSCGRGSDCR